MKKSTVGIIVTSMILIITGIALFVGGIVSAGGLKAAKDQLEEHGFSMFSFERNIAAFEEETISCLNIEVDAAKLELVRSVSNDEIAVKAKGKVDVFSENGTLYIQDDFGWTDRTVIVEIPEDKCFDKAEISGDACDINIQSLNADEIKIEVDAGSVLLEEVFSVSANLEVGAGEIIVEKGSVKALDVSVDLGNFEYDGEILKYGEIECDMGNVDLQLSGEITDYNYEIECSAGNIDIGEEQISGMNTDKMISNHAEKTLKVECDMGNVTIGF